jgi:Tfp pilus assembly protein PilO
MKKTKGPLLLIATALVLIIGLAADQFYVKRLKKEFVSLHAERLETTNALATARIVQENLHRVRDLVFENMIFPNKTTDLADQEKAVFEFITTCINDLKLTLVSLSPQRPQTSGLITTCGWDVEFTGDFFKFGELASEFENSRRIISIESFSVSLAEQQEKSQGGPENKTIKLKMRINTYRVQKS